MWYSSGLDLPGRGIALQDAGRLIAAGLVWFAWKDAARSAAVKV